MRDGREECEVETESANKKTKTPVLTWALPTLQSKI
jgi:hypothetical protein